MRFLLPALLLSTSLSHAAQDVESKPAQSRRPHLRFGGIVIGTGYSHMSGRYPYYGSRYGWGYPYSDGYDPFFFSPFYPGYFTGYARQPLMGEVKLHSGQKEAWVYLNGGFAGNADKLKTMWLEPGVYDLELKTNDDQFRQRIYVLSGKTLKIEAVLTPKSGPGRESPLP